MIEGEGRGVHDCGQLYQARSPLPRCRLSRRTNHESYPANSQTRLQTEEGALACSCFKSLKLDITLRSWSNSRTCRHPHMSTPGGRKHSSFGPFADSRKCNPLPDMHCRHRGLVSLRSWQSPMSIEWDEHTVARLPPTDLNETANRRCPISGYSGRTLAGVMPNIFLNVREKCAESAKPPSWAASVKLHPFT